MMWSGSLPPKKISSTKPARVYNHNREALSKIAFAQLIVLFAPDLLGLLRNVFGKSLEDNELYFKRLEKKAANKLNGISQSVNPH